MKLLLCIIIVITPQIFLVNQSHSQLIESIDISSSPNPVGSGARALGMGGAFIAIADDATAASWNPAGLIQLERPEVSIVGAFIHREEDNYFGDNSEASGMETVTFEEINFMSMVYPFTLFNHNMVLSLNFRQLYNFDREWDFTLINDSQGTAMTKDVDFDQEGNLRALGLSYCAQITPLLSIGATFNFWSNDLYNNGWTKNNDLTASGDLGGYAFNALVKGRDEYSFEGFNTNIGILWNVNSRFTIGAVFKTPFTADLRHKSSFYSLITYPDLTGFDSPPTTISYTKNEEVDMPASYGIGVAYRFSDTLTISADIHRTEWDDFVLEDAEGNKTSSVTGLHEDESDIEPAIQLRLGVEKLFIGNKYIIPLRGGLFYDPAPAMESNDDYYGFSLGAGIAGGRFIFDIAYQYRFGNDVGGANLHGFDFSEDIEEHTFYSSVIIHL